MTCDRPTDRLDAATRRKVSEIDRRKAEALKKIGNALGSMVIARDKYCLSEPVFSRISRESAHLTILTDPADVYAIARNCRTAFRRGFQDQHLSFSIASATQEIEHGEDRNYPNSENNPAAAVAGDGADG